MDAIQTLGEPRALIHAEALLHNLRLLRGHLTAATSLCAIVKADAYGHDASLICQLLQVSTPNPLVDALAVANIDEAVKLPPTALPVLIFRPVENSFLGRQRTRIEQAIRRGWTLTICSPEAAEDVSRIALTCQKRANVQIMLDTGMTRSGVAPDRLNALADSVLRKPALKLWGLCSHFAASESPTDPFTAEQLQRFNIAAYDPQLAAALGGQNVVRHLANSGGIFYWPPSHHDMVRPGISLYGVDPTCKPNMDRALRPVMKWTAPLLLIRPVEAGTGVGYGQTWHAPAATRIGLVPVGYADGYRRSFSNRAVMLINGKPAPVVGRVSMDLTTIDLGRIPEAMIGDEVTILDDDPLSAASIYQLARLADTIPYELFCGIGPRIQRVAVKVAAEAFPAEYQAQIELGN